MITTRPALAWGITFAAATIGTVLLLGLLGWPGSLERCALPGYCCCYCEIIDLDAITRQPVNTWTNLLAVALGLGVLWHVDELSRPGRKESLQNPMSSRTFYSGLYGTCMIFVGTGSMFFHGGVVRYGGIIDNISMNTFVSFLVVYDIVRVLALSKRSFALIYTATNVVLGILVIIPGLGRITFGVLVLAVILMEITLIVLGRAGKIAFTRNWKMLAVSIVVFAFAFVVWILSDMFCDPTSILQWHGFGWHFLAAFATLVIYYYLKGECPHPVVARP